MAHYRNGEQISAPAWDCRGGRRDGGEGTLEPCGQPGSDENALPLHLQTLGVTQFCNMLLTEESQPRIEIFPMMLHICR